MKETVVGLLILAGLTAFNLEAKAQTDTTPSTQQPTVAAWAQQQEAVKQQINKEELPLAAKKFLASRALQQWQIREVYKVAPAAVDADAEATYEVYFTNAEQKRALARFDVDGKRIKSN